MIGNIELVKLLLVTRPVFSAGLFFVPLRSKSGAKTKPKKKSSEKITDFLINDYTQQDHFFSTGGFGSGHKNNLQNLYKRKSIINQKLRKRKYKARVKSGDFVRKPASGLARPRMAHHIGFRVDRGFRVGYATFIGIERTVMKSKGSFRIKFRKYPDLFVTKKSSKSRMGKGKGKIYGRALKIRPGEVFLDYKVRHYRKSVAAVKALRQAIPSTVKPVYYNKWAARLFRNYYENKAFMRNWMFCKTIKRKRKFWEIKKAKIRDFDCTHLKSNAFAGKAHNYRRYFFKWFRTKKHEFRKNKRLIWNAVCVLKAQATRARRFHCTQDFDNLGARAYFYMPSGFFFKTSFGKTGISGGRRRNAKLKLMLSKTYLRKVFEAYFAPDAEGYTGLYKTGNRIFKRKMLRDKFSTRRYVVSTDPFKY